MSELRPILGVPFFDGTLDELLRRSFSAGLVVVPSAPVLADLPRDRAHREAVSNADLAVIDSGLMVLLWMLLRREKLNRISGLRYLAALIDLPEFRSPGASFWVMPNRSDQKANLAWLQHEGVSVAETSAYLAPYYGPGEIADQELLQEIEAKQPAFVVLCLGGGVQERLGYYLRQNLSYRPTILCTGAAIAFLSGQQVEIPIWADRLFLGWLARCLWKPRLYIPRYWRALRLTTLLVRFGEQPPLPTQGYGPTTEYSPDSTSPIPVPFRSNK